MKNFYYLLALLLMVVSVQAQTIPVSNNKSSLTISKTKDYSKIPNYIKFNNDEKITITELDNWLVN